MHNKKFGERLFDQNLIAVHGPQGVGKSTMTNWLREKIPHTNMYRLTGNNDKSSVTGFKKITRSYNALMQYLEIIQGCGFNVLFDGMFTSEQAFCLCGYKEYDFTYSYEALIRQLDGLHYNKILLNLYLKDTSIFEQRLKRDKPKFHDVTFSVAESIRQQELYTQVANDFSDRSIGTSVAHIAMDDEISWQAQLQVIFNDIIKAK